MTTQTYKTIGRYAITTAATVAISAALWNARSPGSDPASYRPAAVDEAAIRTGILNRELVCRPKGQWAIDASITGTAYSIAIVTNITWTNYTIITPAAGTNPAIWSTNIMTTNAIVGYSNAVGAAVGMFPSRFLVSDAETILQKTLDSNYGYTCYNCYITNLWSGGTNAPVIENFHMSAHGDFWFNHQMLGSNGVWWYQFSDSVPVYSNLVYSNLQTTAYAVALNGSDTNYPETSMVGVYHYNPSSAHYEFGSWWLSGYATLGVIEGPGTYDLWYNFDAMSPVYSPYGFDPLLITNVLTWVTKTQVVIAAYTTTNHYAGNGVNQFIVNTNVLNNLAQCMARMSVTEHGEGSAGNYGYDCVNASDARFSANYAGAIGALPTGCRLGDDGSTNVNVGTLTISPGNTWGPVRWMEVGDTMPVWICYGTNLANYDAAIAYASTAGNWVQTNLFWNNQIIKNPNTIGKDSANGVSLWTVQVSDVTNFWGIMRPWYGCLHINGDGTTNNLTENPVSISFSSAKIYCQAEPAAAGAFNEYFDFGTGIPTNRWEVVGSLPDVTPFPFLAIPSGGRSAFTFSDTVGGLYYGVAGAGMAVGVNQRYPFNAPMAEKWSSVMAIIQWIFDDPFNNNPETWPTPSHF